MESLGGGGGRPDEAALFVKDTTVKKFGRTGQVSSSGELTSTGENSYW